MRSACTLCWGKGESVESEQPSTDDRFAHKKRGIWGNTRLATCAWKQALKPGGRVGAGFQRPARTERTLSLAGITEGVTGSLQAGLSHSDPL